MNKYSLLSHAFDSDRVTRCTRTEPSRSADTVVLFISPGTFDHILHTLERTGEYTWYTAVRQPKIKKIKNKESTIEKYLCPGPGPGNHDYNDTRTSSAAKSFIGRIERTDLGSHILHLFTSVCVLFLFTLSFI
jgi:hypothetical protein